MINKHHIIQQQNNVMLSPQESLDFYTDNKLSTSRHINHNITETHEIDLDLTSRTAQIKKISECEQNKENVKANIYDIIQDFRYKCQKLNEHQMDYIKKINECQPEDLIYKNSNIQNSKKKEKLDQMRKIVSMALTYNEDHLNDDKEKFMIKNTQLQQIITQQMRDIEAIDEQIRELEETEECKIIEIEKTETDLKKLLKKKAEIQTVQQKQEERKQKIMGVRKVREMIKSVNDKKIAKIRAIIHELDNLNKHRLHKIQSLNKQYFNNMNAQQVIDIMTNYVEKLNQIKQIKLNQQIKQLKTTSAYKSTIMRNKQSLNNIASPVSVFSPHSTIKPVHQLKSSHPPFKLSSIFEPQQFSMQSIIQKYEELMECFMNLQEEKGIFLENRKKKLQNNCELMLLEKYVIVSIMQQDPSNLDYQSYIGMLETAINKSLDFLKILSVKLKQKKIIEEKVAKIINTQKQFEQTIRNINQQPTYKKNIYHKIEKVLKQAIVDEKSSKMKDFHKNMEKLKMQRSLLEKELQQCAQATNLQGYKDAKIKISNLQDQILELENKTQELPSKKYNFIEYLEQIESSISQSELKGLSKLIQHIQSKEPGETLSKASKRLLPI